MDSGSTAAIDFDHADTFRRDVVTGLADQPRSLPCKYFYDHRGSVLFEQICELDEYYPTRTESEIMRRFAPEMGQQIGPGVMLVEYGSGSSSKTRLLLDHLPQPVAYVPVDISGTHLMAVSSELQQDYPDIEVLPVAADFTSHFELPPTTTPCTHVAVYFPGSTIGNFRPPEAEKLLRTIAGLCGHGGGLLIGIDLDKDPDVLERAYNDPAGVTAEFNLNLMHRIRKELNATVDVESFEHVAFYNQDDTRIEMHLRSRRDQSITLDDQTFDLAAGEMIHTEYSHKYTIDGFAETAARAGLTLRRSWTDAKQHFAVLHLAILD